MGVRLLYAGAVGLSAALLFSVQPMIAKRLLPSLGGTAATWVAVMLFFQAALLAGYFAAHRLNRGDMRQAAVGTLTLLVAGLVLLSPEPDPGPLVTIGTVLLALTASVGLPAIALATVAPGLQRWFSELPPRPDPYWLYVASNVGSLAALLGYPILIEPLASPAAQATAWRVGYGTLIAIVAACALPLFRGADRQNPSPAVPRPGLSTGLRWMWLAFLPSSLMLGATSHITTDLAPVPLLWVLPLAVYLGSYALAFSRFSPHILPNAIRCTPVAVVPLVPLTILGIAAPAWLVVLAHLALLGLLGVVFHGELSRTRPAPEQLTSFYAWLAVGGVLGGLFNALVAPHAFDAALEYPTVLALACLSLPRAHGSSRGLLPSLVVAALGAGLLFSVHAEDPLSGTPIGYGVFSVLILPFLVAFRWPRAAGIGLALLLAAAIAMLDARQNTEYEGRSLFASYRVGVDERRGFRYLAHGNTIHGAASLDERHAGWALPYHLPGSPIAELLESRRPGSEAAVLGLGIGALATYADPDRPIRFYEIDPLMVAIAGTNFDFLGDCGDACSVEVGDGRIALRDSERHFDLIVLDAFNSSAIPTHLLTLEALQTYLEHLEPGGLIAVHITNRYVDLEPALAAQADALGLRAAIREHHPEFGDEPGLFVADSRWIVLAPDQSQLPVAGWRPLRAPTSRPWTDGHADLLSVLVY